MPGINAIAKDTIIAVGGLGTQADKADLNGGGATKAAWDAGAATDFIDTNGGPITADTAIAYDHAGGATDRLFTKVGIGTGVTVGTLVYVSGTNITTGIYEVTAQTNDTISCANIVATGDNADSVCNVGGAINTLQNALDGQDGASYNRYIYDNIATETLAATIDVDTYSGSLNTRVFVIGYNSTLAAEAEIIITTASELVNGLVEITSAVDYTEWHNIDFDGAGKDNIKAAYCVVNDDATGSDFHVFQDCKFHGASADGLYYRGYVWSIFNCKFYLNGGRGLNTLINYAGHSRIVGCTLHDNDLDGMVMSGSYSLIWGNFAYDNGKDGTANQDNGLMLNSSSDRSMVVNNTSHGNPGSGFWIDDLAYDVVVFNNSSVLNGDYGYDLQGKSIQPTLFFGYNHAYANDQNAGIAAGGDYCSETATEAAFQTFRNGNNKTGDPLFTNVGDGTEDFTPASGSDLIDNALDPGTA